MQPVKILWIGSLFALLVALAGCMDSELKSYGATPWPIYDEPKPVEFTDAEKTTLLKFAADNKALFTKIQGQSHAYRAIVKTHNKNALEVNKKRLAALGYDDATIVKMYPGLAPVVKPDSPENTNEGVPHQ